MNVVRNVKLIFLTVVLFCILSPIDEACSSENDPAMLIAARVAYSAFKVKIEQGLRTDNVLSGYLSHVENYTVTINDDGASFVIVSFVPKQQGSAPILGGVAIYKLNRKTHKILSIDWEK